MQTAQAYSLYDRLMALPEGLTGEILNGQLHTQPRPSARHILTGSNVQTELGGPFHRGRGGPGGWWILTEPEIHFLRDTEVCVPDLAGWRRERMPALPDSQKFEVVPDWIAEVLSPATESRDRTVKMAIYGRYGVRYAWLIEPVRQVLEAFGRQDDQSWQPLGVWSGDARVRIPPFDAVILELEALWG